jgi:hypothetical protein
MLGQPIFDGFALLHSHFKVNRWLICVKVENSKDFLLNVVGLFIRRQCLAFDKLPFSQVTQLYHKFRAAYSNVLSEQSCAARTEFCGSHDTSGLIDAIDGDASLSLGDFIDKRIETTLPR